MIAFIVGLIVGLVMCIPIGPINVYVIQTQIKRSRLLALSIAFGGSIMDFIYFMIIHTGLHFIHITPKANLIIQVLGILFIFVLGVKDLFSKNMVITEEVKTIPFHHLLGAMFIGIIIYISNPTLMMTMTGLAAFIRGLNLFEYHFNNILLISLGLAIGSFSWFLILVNIVKKFNHLIRERFLLLFNKISGGLMVALSLFLATKLSISLI